MKPSPRAALEMSSILNALTPREMDQLSAVVRPLQVEKGDIIWLTGRDLDFFGLVASGFVKMTRSTTTGLDATSELMGPGQIFGLLGTIDGKGCPSTAQAVTDCWYLRIPKGPFLEIYQSNAALKDKLVRRVSVRLHSSLDLMAKMTSGRVDERIAAILFLLAESYGERCPEGTRLQVPLTRQEISEMAGTTVESTIRVLSRWQKEGLVSTDRQYITLRDTHRMSQVLSR